MPPSATVSRLIACQEQHGQEPYNIIYIIYIIFCAGCTWARATRTRYSRTPPPVRPDPSHAHTRTRTHICPSAARSESRTTHAHTHLPTDAARSESRAHTRTHTFAHRCGPIGVTHLRERACKDNRAREYVRTLKWATRVARERAEANTRTLTVARTRARTHAHSAQRHAHTRARTPARPTARAHAARTSLPPLLSASLAPTSPCLPRKGPPEGTRIPVCGVLPVTAIGGLPLMIISP